MSGAHIVLSGIELVLAGICIGLLLAAPIGPVNVLVIQRAATGGFWAGPGAGAGGARRRGAAVVRLFASTRRRPAVLGRPVPRPSAPSSATARSPPSPPSPCGRSPI